MNASFEERLKLGKAGEKVVFKFLREQEDTEEVLNLSENKRFQNYGVDGLWVKTNPETQLLSAVFFDVKTDFGLHKTGKIFLEVSSEDDKESGILSTKAEYFFYYEPYEGRLFQISIYALRRWYENFGISYKHHAVQSDYETSGIYVDTEYLKEKYVIVSEERCPKMDFKADFITDGATT